MKTVFLAAAALSLSAFGLLRCSSDASRSSTSGPDASLSPSDAGADGDDLIPTITAACSQYASGAGDSGSCLPGSFTWFCFTPASMQLPTIAGCSVAGILSVGPPPQGRYCCPFGCINLADFDFVCDTAHPRYTICSQGVTPPTDACVPPDLSSFCCP